MKRLLDQLGQRTVPHYGQLVLLVTLLAAGWHCSQYAGSYARTWRTTTYREVRNPPATVVAFLPDAVRCDERVLQGSAWLFYAAAVLWAAQVLLPWSSWLAALAFTLVMALHFENKNALSHSTHLTCVLLWLYALWYGCCAGDIRRALRAGRFWSTPLYPNWVQALALFYVGFFYSLSGVSKLAHSGVAWANGTSLQVWVMLWGDKASVWTQLLLEHRWLAQLLQATTLAAEIAALPAVFFRRARVLEGLALVGFHIGSISVFHYTFHANAVLIGLLFLPLDRWVPALALRWQARRRPRPAPTSAWVRALRARLDVVGWYESTNG
jgi:hypothetical protein